MNLQKMSLWVPVAVVTVVAAIFAYKKIQEERSLNPFADRNLLEKGADLPVIWLYYDNSDVNSRFWSDFGARSTRALNIPFLNVCYDTIVSVNSANYRIEIIGGLPDLALRLGGWDKIPTSMRNPLASIREAELNWIRATVLARFGGLWLQPATVCLQPFGDLPDNRAVFFGMNPQDSFASSTGTSVPSLCAIWSPEPEHPLFVAWADRAFTRLETQKGGLQIRGDEKSDYVELTKGRQDVLVVANSELSRKGASRRPLQLEDLLAAGQEGVLPFDVPSEAKYCPMPWKDMKERRAFGWFLRMSEEQILEADLAISILARRVCSQ